MTTIFDRLLNAMQSYLAGFGEPVASFLAAADGAMPPRRLAPNFLPCTRHLARCAELSDPRDAAVVGLLASNADAFCWGQTYTAADFGQRFMDNYGWLEVFGTRGHFASNSVAGGFLVLGPHLTYPDHHHIAEEIYIPLTGGTHWRKGDGSFTARVAGEVIHHPSNVNHAMKTGDAPLLAIYLWRGGPLAQRSVIGG